MSALRIIQGGIANGDKARIEKAAESGRRVKSWITPKDSQPGDEAVVYIGGYGFFATATIDSHAKPRDGWPNRYCSVVKNLRLIDPPIGLATVRRYIPELAWANYPRSITTPSDEIASRVRDLIHQRRISRLPDWDDDALQNANIEELRRVAVMHVKRNLPAKCKKAIYRARSRAIKLYVLRRAAGSCEFCKQAAPFSKPNGEPYLEPHHTTRVADDGPDDPAHVIALCPNCHRRAHHANDAHEFNSKLKRLIRKLETY